MKNVKFSLAKKSDAIKYANIIVNSRLETYGKFMSQEKIEETCNVEKYINYFENIIDNNNVYVLFIFYNSKVVGVLEYGKPIPHNIYDGSVKDSAELRTLHVSKEYQCQGIGSLAIEYMINHLNRLKYHNVFLFTKKNNFKAINFYKKNGFDFANYENENTSDGIPAIVMKRNI